MTNIFDPILPVRDLPKQRDAARGYSQLFSDDEALRQKFEELFKNQLRVFDEMMAFNYELLIIVYQNVDVWKDIKQRRFVHAALSSSFNHLLFARKAISLGYPFENQLVFRSAMEWFGRAVLFHEDEAAVEQFINQGDLKDSCVRNRLEAIFDLKQPGAGRSAAKLLRRLYRQFSTFGHATFQSLVTRTFVRPPKAKNKTQRRNISKVLGKGVIFGGFMTRELAYLALINMFSLSEMVMQIAVAQIPNDKPDIVRKHEELRAKATASITAMQTEVSDATAEQK